MRDIVIKIHQIRRELLLLGLCIVVAEVLNIYAIAHYDGRWTEVFLSLGYVFVAGLVLYVILAFCRLLFAGLYCLFRRRKKTNHFN